MARSGWRDGLPLAGVLLGAAVVRVVLLLSPAMRLDGDEAITGVMARRIMDGHHRAFFAGQDYMGAGEQYLQAAVLAVLPDTDLTLRLPQVALAVVACVLVHRLAQRCGLSHRRALLAAALFAAGPYFNAYWGANSRGAYASALVLGLAGLVLALSVGEDDPQRVRKLALFGLVGGLALWANQQAAYLLVPAAWWLLATVRRRWLSSALAAAGGFVVGAAPSLWHWVTHDQSPFANHEGDSSVAERAHHLLAETLPDLLGVRDDGAPLIAWLPPAFVVLVALCALGAAVDRHRAGILAVVRLRTTGRRGVDLLLLTLVVLPLLFIQSGASTIASSRYVFVLYGVLPVLAAALPVPRSLVRTRTDKLVAATLVVAAVAIHTAVGADRYIAQDDGGHEAAAGQVVVNEDLDEVVDALVDAGARTAYADYWLAWPLTWEADGDVLVDSLDFRRFPHLSAAVEADPSPALVVAAAELADVTAELDGRGAAYDVVVAGGWGVITGIEPGIHLGGSGSMAERLRESST